MAKEPVRPSRRWVEVERQMSVDTDASDIGGLVADQSNEVKELRQMFDDLYSTIPSHLKTKLRKVEDLSDDVSNMTGKLSYDTGFGDGWHAGALAAVRAIVGNSGAQVPLPSPGLGILMGLPHDPLPPGTPGILARQEDGEAQA